MRGSIYALNNSNVFDAYSRDSSDSGDKSRAISILANYIELTVEMLVVPQAVSKPRQGLAV